MSPATPYIDITTGSPGQPRALAIYTDLDGSLLDHHTYSHAAADSLLAELEQHHIPVIPCTSKTRAELLALRQELDNNHPFIIENGAAVCIPEGYLPAAPEGCTAADGLWIKTLVAPRRHWLALLAQVGAPWTGSYRSFAALSAAEIATLTGLPPADAACAAQREYGEPVHWQGSATAREAFVQALRAAGAAVLQGGRFLHVSGPCDKGQALRWLNAQLAVRTGGQVPVSIAVGDSQNDIAMLEAADHALIVRSPAHPPPAVDRHPAARVSHQYGDRGWAEGIRALLQTLYHA